MADPKSVVYGGSNLGAAQVLGKPGDPFGMLIKSDEDKRKRDEIKRLNDVKLKDKRDSQIREDLNVDPELTFAPFNDQIINSFDKDFRQWTRDQMKSGVSPDDINYRTERQVRLNKQQANSKKAGALKNNIMDKRKEIASSKYLDQNFYGSLINDFYLNEDGTAKDLNSLSVEGLNDLVLNNPNGFKIQDYAKDFLANSKENVYQYTLDRLDKTGKFKTIEDVQLFLDSNLFRPDPNTASGVEEDEEGRPIVNAIPEFISAFTTDPLAKAFVNQLAEKSGLSVKEVVQNLVRPNTKTRKESSVTTRNLETATQLTAFEKELKRVSGGKNRLSQINAIANAFVGDDSFYGDAPSSLAETAAGYLATNSKINGNPISGYTFVGPGQNPKSVLGQLFENDNPEVPKIVFRAETGTRGGRPVYELVKVPLGRPETAAILNSIFETSETEGKDTYSMEDLNRINKDSGDKLYNLREGKFRESEVLPDKEVENIVSKLKVNYGNVDDLMGKTVGGKKVIKAQATYSGLLARLGGGTFKGYSLTYDDGTKEEISALTEEGLNKLKQIVKNVPTPSKEQKPGTVKLGIEWN